MGSFLGEIELSGFWFIQFSQYDAVCITERETLLLKPYRNWTSLVFCRCIIWVMLTQKIWTWKIMGESLTALLLTQPASLPRFVQLNLHLYYACEGFNFLKAALESDFSLMVASSWMTSTWSSSSSWIPGNLSKYAIAALAHQYDLEIQCLKMLHHSEF